MLVCVGVQAAGNRFRIEGLGSRGGRSGNTLSSFADGQDGE